MTIQQMLPFRSNRRVQSNRDLLGRTYFDRRVAVTVLALCPDDHSRVLVKRTPGGTMRLPAFVLRAIFDEEDRRKKIAA